MAAFGLKRHGCGNNHILLTCPALVVQEDTVANADSTNTEGSLARAIWRLELARAKHVLRAYLRTRLLKLEACCAAVLADQGMQTRLSQRELQYAHVSLCMLIGIP